MKRPGRPQNREWCPRGVIRRMPDLVVPCASHGVPCHDCIVLAVRQERLAEALRRAQK